MSSLKDRFKKTKFYEILVPQSKYYTLERPRFVWTVHGIKKFWEVTPIVGLVTLVFSFSSYYFTIYYPLSRGDAFYTKTPRYRTIDLEHPPQWKYKDYEDYKTYKPLLKQKDALHRMHCVEYDRLQKCNDANVVPETMRNFNITKPKKCRQKENGNGGGNGGDNGGGNGGKISKSECD